MPTGTLRKATMSVRDIDRFFAKVRGGDECWEWTAARDPNGYGRFGIGSLTYLAHRVTYYLAAARAARTEQ